MLNWTTYQHAEAALTATATADEDDNVPIRLLFLGEKLVACVKKMVTVWDITRGIVAYGISSKNSILDAASFQDRLYLLVKASSSHDRLLVHQYTKSVRFSSLT